MKGRPPKKTMTPEQERAASAFVDGAEAPGPKASGAAPPPATARAGRGGQSTSGLSEEARPWEAAHVREDVVKGYALRLPEPLYLKLKWVAERTGRSMNAVCREAVEDEVEAVLRREGG